MLLVLATAACGGSERPPGGRSAGARDSNDAGTAPANGSVAGALAAVLSRSGTMADSVEARLKPVRLLRPGEEAALRSYSNADNLAVARRQGAPAKDDAELRERARSGRLVRLEDGRYWVLRDLDASEPYVTPATRSLLERIGSEFQRRLTSMGVPAYRLEVSSALRTAEQQAALRRTNVNATAGRSAHEYGTTVDLAYSGYAAPATLPAELTDVIDDAPASVRTALEEVARRTLERVAARKSRELEAVLGGVLRDAQSRGEVLVTLEQLQPVFHITATGATAGSGR